MKVETTLEVTLNLGLVKITVKKTTSETQRKRSNKTKCRKDQKA